MDVKVTNYVNWHRENLRSDRENTGNLKIENLSVYPVPLKNNGFRAIASFSARVPIATLRHKF